MAGCGTQYQTTHPSAHVEMVTQKTTILAEGETFEMDNIMREKIQRALADFAPNFPLIVRISSPTSVNRTTKKALIDWLKLKGYTARITHTYAAAVQLSITQVTTAIQGCDKGSDKPWCVEPQNLEKMLYLPGDQSIETPGQRAFSAIENYLDNKEKKLRVEKIKE